MKLFYLVDTKSNTPYYPRFAESRDVILREMACDLRKLRENKAYSVVACWNDSKCVCIDLETKEIKDVPEFRNFFSPAPEKEVEHENKNDK